MLTKDQALILKPLWEGLNELSPITYNYRLDTFFIEDSYYVFLDGIEILDLYLLPHGKFSGTRKFSNQDRLSHVLVSDGNFINGFITYAESITKNIETLLGEAVHFSEEQKELFATMVGFDFAEFFGVILTPVENERCSHIYQRALGFYKNLREWRPE